MKTVLVVTSDKGLRTRLEEALGDRSVFVAESDDEALRTLSLVAIDTIVRDCTGPRRDLPGFASGARELAPGALVVAIGAPEDEADAADVVVPRNFTRRDLDNALRQVADRHRLLGEIAALRSRIAAPRAVPAADPVRDSPALARILTEFGRVFAAGFDLPRLLEMFLDVIGELLRPTRMALLLPEDTRQVFRVAAHRGLAPQIVQSARLSAASGLGRWLAFEGRPALLPDLTEPGLARELMLLGGVVAVPLLTHGELVAVLAVGQPVVGNGYGRLEMEILFDLATHLATAIRDIALHHQLQQEKEFSERILAHMSSGVVTIGRDHRIGTFNRRAEEILGLRAADVVRQDLRRLPSPLGDMIYEALSTGRTLPTTEIQLPGRGRWLEVSAYPVRGDQTGPLGAVLVFEDRTAQKELAAEKRQAEQYQLLARVVARIADEVKNPLVSINTFVELIDERFDEPEFRKQFSSVVRRDIRRLLQVVEKLAGLVGEGELNFCTVDVQAVVDDVVSALDVSDDSLGKRLQVEVSRNPEPQMVRIDVPQFRRALSYLIRHLTQHSPGEEARVSISVARDPGREAGDSVRLTIGSRTASIPQEKLDRLFDPVHTVQESLIDVGPAVSQRLIEAAGGRLEVRQGRHELAFQVTLPAEGR